MGLFSFKKKEDKVLSKEDEKIKRDKILMDFYEKNSESTKARYEAKTPMEKYLVLKDTPFWKQSVQFSIKNENGNEDFLQLSDTNSNAAKEYPEMYELCKFVVDENLYIMANGNMAHPFNKYPNYPKWMLKMLEKSLATYEKMADKSYTVEQIRNTEVKDVYPEIANIMKAFFLGDLGDYIFMGQRIAEARMIIILNKICDYMKEHSNEDTARNLTNAYEYLKANDSLGKLLA